MSILWNKSTLEKYHRSLKDKNKNLIRKYEQRKSDLNQMIAKQINRNSSKEKEQENHNLKSSQSAKYLLTNHRVSNSNMIGNKGRKVAHAIRLNSKISNRNNRTKSKSIVSKKGMSLYKRSWRKDNQFQFKYVLATSNLPPQYLSWMKYNSRDNNNFASKESKTVEQSHTHSEKSVIIFELTPPKIVNEQKKFNHKNKPQQLNHRKEHSAWGTRNSYSI